MVCVRESGVERKWEREREHDLITAYGSARRKGGIYVLGRGRIKSK